MMTQPSSKHKTTTIELLGKLYHIRCPDQDTPKLQQAARNLNQILKQLSDTNHAPAPEKLAIIAALNLSAKLLELEATTSAKLDQLITLINSAAPHHNEHSSAKS